MNEYVILNIISSTENATMIDRMLKTQPFASKKKHGAGVKYSKIITKICAIKDEGMSEAMVQYENFLSCYNVSPELEERCKLEGSRISDAVYNLFIGYEELLTSSIKIGVIEIITDDDFNVIYFDGSKSNAGCSGAAVVCEQKASSGTYEYFTGNTYATSSIGAVVIDGTNNVGELTGFEIAINVKSDKPYCVIVGDSEYTIKTFREWIYNWEKSNWVNSQKKQVVNADMIKKISNILNSGNRNILLKWTKAHVGNPMNELCDTVCKQLTGYVK